jgi:hypothetical protein
VNSEAIEVFVQLEAAITAPKRTPAEASLSRFGVSVFARACGSA